MINNYIVSNSTATTDRINKLSERLSNLQVSLTSLKNYRNHFFVPINKIDYIL